MKVLAVCATYGRIPYLGRMLASFEAQEYDDKHLVVINDDRNITLECDRPNVTILNCNNRKSISIKRNMGITSGHYDIIMPWDDDDIYLPNRISNHVKEFNNPDINAYRNKACYIIYGDEFRVESGAPVNSIAYRTSEWFRVGGYTELSQSFEDVELFRKMEKIKEVEDYDNLDFVYHFGGVNYHASCYPTNLEGIAYFQLQKLNLFGKKYKIEPNQEQFIKVMGLVQTFKQKQATVKIIHKNDCEFDIVVDK